MKKRGSEEFPFDDLAGPRYNPRGEFTEPVDMQRTNRTDNRYEVHNQAENRPVPPVKPRPASSVPAPRTQNQSNSYAPQTAVRKDGYYTPAPQARERVRTNPPQTAPEYQRGAPRRRTLNRQIQILGGISIVLLIIVLILGYFAFRDSDNASGAATATASVTAASMSLNTSVTPAVSDSALVPTTAPGISVTPAVTVSNDPNSLSNLPPSAEHPVIALTFDDGPSASLTPGLLDTLKEKGVHATFFVLGQETLDADPALLKRMIDEGHEIGNHSYDHAIYTDLTADEIRDELKKTNDAIFAATGTYPTVMRPPTGGSNDTVLAISTEMNLACVNWSWESCPEDWLADHQTPEFISNHVITNARNGHIVLLHDIHQATVDSIAAMIDGLVAKGYRFATVSELLAAQPEGKKNGVLYYYATFS